MKVRHSTQQVSRSFNIFGIFLEIEKNLQLKIFNLSSQKEMKRQIILEK